MLIASFFVLGGNFWDKLRALFLRMGTLVDAGIRRRRPDHHSVLRWPLGQRMAIKRIGSSRGPPVRGEPNRAAIS
jgi:hypothetical protein